MLNYHLSKIQPLKKSCTSQRFVGRTVASFSSSSKDPAETDISNNATTNSHAPGGRHQSRFQNPIVAQLWDARRERKFELMSMHDADSDSAGSGTLAQLNAHMVHEAAKQEQEGRQTQQLQQEPKFRYPRESRTSVNYPFSTDDYLKAAYCSPGGTMRFGKVRTVC